MRKSSVHGDHNCTNDCNGKIHDPAQHGVQFSDRSLIYI